jgi:indole-3-acetate monooxygenase
MFEKLVSYPPLNGDRKRMQRTPYSAAALETAKTIGAELRARASESELLQRLPEDILANMAEAEFFRMGGPVVAGGSTIDYPVLFRIIEELATGDASAGWCVLTNMAAATMSACLPESGAKQLWETPHHVIAGSPVPGARALRTDGGYQLLDGRWFFASNSGHATHFLGGFQIVKDEADPGSSFPPKPGEPFPETYVGYFRKDQVELVEGSANTIGLKGTRSGQFVSNKPLLDSNMAFAMFDAKRTPLEIKGPLGIGGHSAVAMGIARHALECFYELARSKGSRQIAREGPLSEHPVVNHEIAIVEAELRAARAQFYDVLEDCWARWIEVGYVDDADYLESELANVHAASVARSVVDLTCKWGATSAVFAGSELERCRRDIQTASAHMAIQDNNLEIYGKALMGGKVRMLSAFDAAGLKQSRQSLDARGGNAGAANGAMPAATEADLAADPELAIAHRFVSAMIASDVDLCQSMMDEAIVMQSPMGPREGPQACGDLMREMNKLGATPMDLPQRRNGEIVAINHAPMGEVQLVFMIKGDKVADVGIRF